MANPITPSRKMLYKESFRYGGSVSEHLLFALGAMCNFLNIRHIETKRFTINGNYSPAVLTTLPHLAVDGIHTFEFPSEIANLWIYNRVKGVSGNTVLDIKWKAHDSTTWESIFTGPGGVQPSFGSLASNYETCGVGDVKDGFVAPVPVKTQFATGDAIRMDVVDAMIGTPSGCGIILNYRPI